MNDKVEILIVDDDENICWTLMLIFGRKNYVVDTAGTGQEAMDKVRNKFFNIVLMDIKLPDLEGIELLASIKALHPDTAVIMITGHPTLDTAMRAVNEGASAYITKPLNLNKVFTTVTEALNHQQSKFVVTPDVQPTGQYTGIQSR